jgi:hypothetical protein
MVPSGVATQESELAAIDEDVSLTEEPAAPPQPRKIAAAAPDIARRASRRSSLGERLRSLIGRFLP